MARLSASNSAAASSANGHISAPSTATSAGPASLPSTSHSNVGDSKPVEDDIPDTDWEDEAVDTAPLPMDDTLFPGGTRDLSYIGVQAFFLGTVFAAGISGTITAVVLGSAWWRLPAFATSLALFHFLEYFTTARYNTPALRAESFLLFNNGRAYQAAHGCATLELIVSRFFPQYGQTFVNPLTIALGIALIVVGQLVRSLAMAQAGPSFNHVIAREHKEHHKLVTHGLYSIFRHPSYFGFFWWAIGTQFLVGNKICLVGYIIVLWQFFYRRIQGEEKFLVNFFGDKYIEYRKKTGTKIPFIR
ncbi:unnamed protein product [Cercospora beticola]|nr:unnamed protein product [Cercospora beticola]